MNSAPEPVGDPTPDGSESTPDPTPPATDRDASDSAGTDTASTDRDATDAASTDRDGTDSDGTGSDSTAAKPAPKRKPAANRRPAANRKPAPTKKPAPAAKQGSTASSTTTRKPAPRRPARATAKPKPPPPPPELVLSVRGLTKRFDDTVAVDAIDLDVRAGWFMGIVGPNGAGKTTTLSMITGLMRPDEGTVLVHDTDVWANPDSAKRRMGVLPDRLRLFDRLTGNQLLYYSGVLRGLDAKTVRERIADLSVAFGLEDALGRLVTDYSSGMTKKIALAAAMIHSPRILVLDEPFESVDPVSASAVIQILERYVAAGGTVVLSSHSMDLVQRVCDHVAVIVGGTILAQGTMDEVRGGKTLEERFVALAGGHKVVGGLEWLHTFSD